MTQINDEKYRIPPYLIALGFFAYIGVIISAIIFRSEFGFGRLYIQILGIFLVFFGGIFSMIARINLRKSYHFLPQAKELIIDGLYRWFRHPVYIGNQVFLIGFAILLGSVIGLFLTIIIIIPIHIIRVKYEEKILIKTFGDKYIEYKDQTLF